MNPKTFNLQNGSAEIIRHVNTREEEFHRSKGVCDEFQLRQAQYFDRTAHLETSEFRIGSVVRPFERQKNVYLLDMELGSRDSIHSEIELSRW